MGERRPFARLRSVRVRITLVATLVTALAVAAAAFALLRSVEDTQLSRIRDESEARLDEVAAQLRDGVDPQVAVNAASARGLVLVLDAAGQVVAAPEPFLTSAPDATVRVEAGIAFEAAEAVQSVAPAGGVQRFQILLDGGGAPPSQVPFEALTRSVETPSGVELTVFAGAPVDEVERSVAAVRRGLVLGLPLLVALVAAVTWLVVGRALHPVDAMRAEVEAITGSTIHRRVPEPATHDEIGRLAHTMNAMLDRLERAAERQHQFVADASHELRSPMAAIRAQLEVARRQGSSADWERVARVVLDEEARLEAVVTDLLLLASADDTGIDPDALPTIDLGGLAAAETARPRPVPVRLHQNGSVPVRGVRVQLERVLANLVDNAARYATSGVDVHVSTAIDPAWGRASARLVVEDDGPGIAPADRERVFARFTRLEGSRARDEGGTGLGLALVRSIVTRHGGRVWLDESPAGGARATVELPLAPAATP